MILALGIQLGQVEKPDRVHYHPLTNVYPSLHLGRGVDRGRVDGGGVYRGVPPLEMANETGNMHPTGMHSSFYSCLLQFIAYSFLHELREIHMVLSSDNLKIK